LKRIFSYIFTFDVLAKNKSVKVFPSDNELVDKLQQGDVEAFDTIYAKYSQNLYAFSLKFSRSPAEAEELVQSVFMKLWENHKNLKKESSFKSYLFTVAYNDLCKLFRKRSYQQKFISDTLIENNNLSTEIEDSIDYQSVLDRVLQIVNKLPEKQKAVFLKSRQEGKSSREIAKEIGLSPGTVDNYKSEALKFIRVRLKQETLPVLLLCALFVL